MFDNKYKGTKWEMNLFDIYPELEEFYKPGIPKRDANFKNDIHVINEDDNVPHPERQEVISSRGYSYSAIDSEQSWLGIHVYKDLWYKQQQDMITHWEKKDERK